MTCPSLKRGSWLEEALAELITVCRQVDPAAIDTLAHEFVRAKRIATYGVGREGLMMQALCMRLVHAGLDAHVVGDMSAPPLGHDDLLVVSAGPGRFATVLALQEVAAAAGARVALVTATLHSPATKHADVILYVPARTMANDLAETGLLPMGSAFEAIEFLLSDMLALLVCEKRGESPDKMRSRHTNLE